MTAAKTVFMFSGQGSQYFQMGKDLFEKNDVFRASMLRLDDLVRQISGVPVLATLYEDGRHKGDPFDRTLLTHPAIFMVEYSLAQTLMQSGLKPDMVLGVSLGSFAAAAIAGFLDVEEALAGVVRQAIALEESCEPGAMIAVLGDPKLFEQDFLGGRSELAAVNFASHFVVSARQADLEPIEAGLRSREIAYQRLPVSFPFHSQWIEKGRERFEPFMQSIRYKPATLPYACCDRAAVVSELPRDYFWNIVRHPMLFREMTARLEEEGPRRYVDVGPAGTLATFLKYSLPATTTSTMHPILTPYGLDQRNLAAVVKLAA